MRFHGQSAPEAWERHIGEMAGLETAFPYGLLPTVTPGYDNMNITHHLQ